jgi:hypothetical protein
MATTPSPGNEANTIAWFVIVTATMPTTTNHHRHGEADPEARTAAHRADASRKVCIV